MVTPETVSDVLSPTQIMYLPLSGISGNNPGVTLDQGWVHRGQRWAGVRMEGDAMFITHPDMSLCVQANPARHITTMFTQGVLATSMHQAPGGLL